MPLVSVIIPTYNSEKFISKTIKSVLHQTYTDWELIIVDDCSNDQTRSILEKFEIKDSRIRLIFLESNSGGPAHPKNIGIKNAKGEYISFLDHDDEWFPDKLAKQVNFFIHNKNNNVTLVTCNSVLKIFGDEHEYTTPKYRKERQLSELLNRNFICSCSSIVVRKGLFDNIGLFDENLKTLDDWDLYIRISKAGMPLDLISENLFIWNARKDSAENNLSFLDNAKELKYILAKHERLFSSNKKSYVSNLRSIGVLEILSGNFNVGRRYIVKSFKFGDRSLTTVLLYLLSLLRSRNLFKILLRVRKKRSKQPLDLSQI